MTDAQHPPEFNRIAEHPSEARPTHEQAPHHFGAGFQLRAQLVMALVFVGLTIFTLGRFREAVIWGAILAIVCWPIQNWLKCRLPDRHAATVAPAALVLAILLIFLVPLGAIGVEVAQEAEAAHAWVDNAQANGTPEPSWISQLPYGSAQISAWWQQNLSDPQGEHRLLHKMGADRTLGVARRIGHDMANGTVLFVFSLLILFFLLRSGRHLTDHCLTASHRLFGPRGESVMRQITNSVRGSMAGLVLVGLGEGVLITISYVIAGAPQPLLLGILTAICSMVPMLGSVAVAISVLLLLAEGSVGAAIAVAVFSMIVLFAADHFVRPVLIGGSTKLPFVWVLLGILGGLETWGLIGLFVGPALMAVTHLLWRIISRPGLPDARDRAEA